MLAHKAQLVLRELKARKAQSAYRARQDFKVIKVFKE
jgi:hypothetical protein